MISERPLAATAPTVRTVIDCRSGKVMDAATVIGSDVAELIVLRDRVHRGIAAGSPLYLCAYCKSPVYIRAHCDQRQQHFAHRSDAQRDACPAAEARRLYTLDELSALKFRGRQEGALHRRLKSQVFHSLVADPRFSDVQIERRIASTEGKWRQPDVSATFAREGGPLRVVFEIQLSSTAARVMAERKEFYARLDTLLVWILDRYDETWQSLTKQHAFYPNRRNAFIASDATLEASLAARALVLECVWQEPEGLHQERNRRGLVRFDQLTFDANAQQAFHFDFDAALEELKSRAQSQRVSLHREVITLIMRRNAVGEDWETKRSRWIDLQQQVAIESALDLSLPDWNNDRTGFFTGALIALSMHQRRPLATRHEKLLDLVHHCIDRHPQQCWLMLCAIKTYSALRCLSSQDQTGRLRHKLRTRVFPELCGGIGEFKPDRRHEDLFAYLFPRVAEDFGEEPSIALKRWFAGQPCESTEWSCWMVA